MKNFFSTAFMFLFIINCNHVIAKTDTTSDNKASFSADAFLRSQIKKDGFSDPEKNNKLISREYYSGIISLIIGTVGYYTSDSDVLKIAYSGVQSLGIVSIGSSVNHELYPSLENLYLDVTQNKSANTNEMATIFLKNYSMRDRAKRISRLYTTGLLCLQFTANAVIDNSDSDLKKVYGFLAGVNLLVFAHSFFYISEYEKKSLDLNLVMFEKSEKSIPGVLLSWDW